MNENTKIIQCFLPPMIAGKYAVKVVQCIEKANEELENITKTFEFGVDAARFTINASDIYSVYPPANKDGNYSESLPHVVFSRRTLPWERTIDDKLPLFQRDTTPQEKKNTQESPPVPWMALILFTEDEMKELRINIGAIADILSPESPDKITRPGNFKKDKELKTDLKLMAWEKKTDGCFTIDITKKQFEEYIPSMESLSFLAHSKEVKIAHKDKEGIIDVNSEGKGVFSVIVGNRLPTPEKQHTALLVSLEGYADYLKGANPQKNIPDENKVRLVVLAYWNFTNSGNNSFIELIKGIEIKSMVIREDEVPELSRHFNSGYAPLEHLTRNGVKTLSWYHGPFVPKLSPSQSINISFSSSDAALRYDKSTGFFDVSFAAAWQLGRILALQNQGFSKAILNWRIVQKQHEMDLKRNRIIGDIIQDNSDNSLKNKVIKYLGEINPVEIGESETQIPKASSEIPDEVKKFLGDLFILKGVPFSYLVPHEFFLEKKHEKKGKNYTGTLAFFYVDPNWIEALLDGALSIGHITNKDTIMDKAMSGEFIRGYKSQNIEEPENNQKNILVKELNITGFLFRSDLISGWRGLEIEAYNADEQLLSALRFERIDSDVFLGIFNGNVSKIIIIQPYEGLHFGIKIDEKKYLKNLKNENGTNQNVQDGTADVNRELNGGLIESGIIDISGLANIMKQKLMAKNWMNTVGESKGQYFTSAEFAYQMVDSPVRHTILVNMIVNKTEVYE